MRLESVGHGWRGVPRLRSHRARTMSGNILYEHHPQAIPWVDCFDKVKDIPSLLPTGNRSAVRQVACADSWRHAARWDSENSEVQSKHTRRPASSSCHHNHLVPEDTLSPCLVPPGFCSSSLVAFFSFVVCSSFFWLVAFILLALLWRPFLPTAATSLSGLVSLTPLSGAALLLSAVLAQELAHQYFVLGSLRYGAFQ